MLIPIRRVTTRGTTVEGVEVLLHQRFMSIGIGKGL